jgi:hypothetical protein
MVAQASRLCIYMVGTAHHEFRLVNGELISCPAVPVIG